MTKLYRWLASLLAIFAVVGAIYAKGSIDARHKLELTAVQTELSAAHNQMRKEREARVADARLAREAAERAASLKSEVSNLQDYVETLEDANRQCLSGADTERLRKLWK